MMRFVVEQLRKEGIRLVYYLDDICLLAQTKEEMHKVCTRDFLGFTFNSTNMKITVPVKKINKLISRIKQALQQPTHSCRWYASLMGKMTSMIPAIGEALLHIRYLQRDLAHNLQRHHQKWEAPFTLSTNSKAELQWWMNFVTDKNGLPIHKIDNPKPAITIHVDASDIAWGVASPELETMGYWTEEEKAQSINVRELSAIYFALQLHARKRYVFTTTTTTGSRHTRLMQQLQSQGRISTYSWSRQRTSRSTESNNDPKPTIRNQTAEENFQPDQPDVGTPENRRLRITYESPTTSVLEPETGPSSDRSRCLQPTMDNKGNVPFPAMEIHTSSNTTTEETEDTISSTDNTVVDNTTLVSDGNEDETASRTNNIQASTMDNGRMEVIRKKRKNEGLNDDEIEFLAHTIRQNTNRVYNNGWRKWEDWCKQQQPPVDPQEYNVDHVFKFLMDNRKYSVQHLNGIRSAIASVFKVIHPTQPPLAQQEKIAQFFQAKRLQEIKIPKEADMITWDTDILTNFIKITWADNTLLTLTDLQFKTLSLLCLATMARPRSDIGRLQFQNIHFKIEEGQAISVIIHFTEAKETNIKSTQLGLVEDRELCPTTTLYFFIQKTASIRSSLPKDHTLFLTYLDNKDKETSSVRPSTVSNWIKSIMNKAGIDITKYKAHSIRSASSTKAVEKSHSIQTVKQHANWSSNANTFERYYYKPTAQQSSSTSIANSIFSLTDNHTTLTDGAELKRIVVGTTNNYKFKKGK
ncbi:hypothetical protein G6F61_011843 [Rhizopus arrhizus]|nr:hypothetical protein G6F61_011843 [Rhizopus arrhizus]